METRSSPPRWRIAIVAAALFLAFLLLATQLIRWQIVERGLFLPETALASETARGEKRGHERGIIVDAQGEPLAFDTYRWEIWVEPRHVPASQAEELAADLVQTLGSELIQTPEELLEILTGEEPGTVTLAKAASEAVGEQIATWDHLAVGARPIPTRFYPQGSLGAHMLGFVNAQPRAYYGVEQYYDDYLWRVETPFFRSSPEVRAAYAQLPQSWQKHLPSASGQDLVLTTDRRIQYAVEEILAEAIGTYQADAGTIIIMEPHTGAILAMTSLPAYDPNRYGLTNDRVLADPAISRQYEPGSVFKIVTMAAGIDAGVITADTVLTDTVSMEVGGRTIQNSNRRGHGQVTIRETLVRSLNIPTAQVALMLEESLFYQYVKRFGFGQLTEVDLANEGPGTVKVPGDPLWSQSDLATNAFGQGLAVTPMQMATATAVIANGGYLVRPHVVDSMVFRGRVIRADTGFVRRVVRAETAEVMTDLMTDVVEVGVPLAKVPGYAVAGKTGTAQVAIEGGYHPTATIHSFVGFAPADDPSFVAVVKLDSPKTHFWASGTAAPTFARLVKRLVRLLHIPPEQVAKP